VLRRTVLAVLLAAAFALVTISYQGGGPGVHRAQLRVLDVFAPIERGMNRAWDPVAGAWAWSGRLFTAMGDAPKLRDENAQLRTSLRVAHIREDEDKDLRRILDVGTQGVYPDGYDRVVGRVISRGSSSIDHNITINVGSSAGIEMDDAVMTADGLIGRITGVSAHTAKVGLILDTANRPTATIVGADGSSGTGTLETITSGSEPAMRIEKVRQSEDVDPGDEVFTSGFKSNGLSSRYPADIPIGQVRSAINGAANEYKTIQVDPYANFEDLRFVFVLVSKTDDSALDVEPVTPEPRATLSDTESPEVAQPITAAQARAKIRAAAAARAAAKRRAAKQDSTTKDTTP
jgi:rod shape-determining protein MreC